MRVALEVADYSIVLHEFKFTDLIFGAGDMLVNTQHSAIPKIEDIGIEPVFPLVRNSPLRFGVVGPDSFSRRRGTLSNVRVHVRSDAVD